MWMCWGGVGVLSVCLHVYMWTLVCVYGCMCVYMRYCLCASLAQHPAQGEGLILCGLERINFVLTLAGCGLHPYPPLLSLPGARLRRQASGDGENKGKRESKRERGAEILKSVILEKAFILCCSLYLHFMSWPHCNSSSNMCIVLSLSVRVCVCVFIRQTECLFLPDVGWHCVQGQPLHIRSVFSAPLDPTLPFALSSVCSIWKSVCSRIVQTSNSQSAFLCLCLVDTQRQ